MSAAASSCPLCPLHTFLGIASPLSLLHLAVFLVAGRRLLGIPCPGLPFSSPEEECFSLGHCLAPGFMQSWWPPMAPRGGPGASYMGVCLLPCAEVQFDGRSATYLNWSPANSIHGLPSPFAIPFSPCSGLCWHLTFCHVTRVTGWMTIPSLHVVRSLCGLTASALLGCLVGRPLPQRWVRVSCCAHVMNCSSRCCSGVTSVSLHGQPSVHTSPVPCCLPFWIRGIRWVTS